jgi:hypothetical protein
VVALRLAERRGEASQGVAEAKRGVLEGALAEISVASSRVVLIDAVYGVKP